MARQSLAVKYRPQKWEDVVEQGSTVAILKNQLETGEIKHAYLFCGGAGTGKTTCARIFANEINKHQGNPIELDAASNNSVDDVRTIIQQSKVQSVDSEYRIFIIDECVTGDVEILTTDGFKRFDECDGTETVAQYNNGRIEFVTPNSWVKQPYKGDLVKWSPRNWCSIRMTPNHVQPLYFSKSGEIKEAYIKDVKFAQSNNLIVSGKGVGAKNVLTPLDRLAIACQADATVQSVHSDYTHWSIKLTKQRKIDRLLEIFAGAEIEYAEIACVGKSRRFTFNTPNTITKYFRTHFSSSDFGFYGARQFIEEVVAWDGYIQDNYTEYMSIERANADFVASIAVLGGYSVRQRIQTDNRELHYKDVHKVFMYDTNLCNCQHIGKTVTHEAYDGLVYCVKVPSHQIVIRSQGFVFITGNCHALSNSAWQAFLKVLEEPPKKAIFIFATTDAQKIPKTILSRVQRYDFQRISHHGIFTRLCNVIADEHLPEPDMEAIDYIAKLADGGMRDGLTMLDKCLAFSEELQISDVVKVLGVVDYSVMLDLTDAIVSSDKARIIEIVESIHADGKDLKLFTREYLNFMLDVVKYDITQSSKYLQLPATYAVALSNKDAQWFGRCQKLLGVVLQLVNDVKWDSAPKMLIESRLLLF